MARKRTTVFADEDDLAVLKSAARRRGVAEAELIREAIHLAALANRDWPEPFVSRTFRGPATRSSRAKTTAAAWEDAAAKYEQSKHRRR